MGKTSSTVKNRYNAKAYDQIPIRVPKGRKADIESYAKERGESVNGLVNSYFRGLLGIPEDDWKKTLSDSGDA